MKRRGNSWDVNYEKAKEYFIKHGNLNVPQRYETADGVKLGYWIDEQRKEYRDGKLSKKELEKLRAIGFIPNKKKARKKRESLNEVIILFYIRKVFPDAIKLYSSDWVGAEIDIYIPSLKIGIEFDSFHFHKDLYESDENKGIICDLKGVKLIRIRDGRLKNIENCYKQYTLNPDNYITELSATIVRIISDINGTTIECDIQKDFDDIILLRDEYTRIRWNQIYALLADIISKKGIEYIKNQIASSEEYINFKYWISSQKGFDPNDPLSLVHIYLLDMLGIPWGRGKKLKWLFKYILSTDYIARKDNHEIQARDYAEDGTLIGAWLGRQRDRKKNRKLSAQETRMMNALMMKCDW